MSSTPENSFIASIHRQFDKLGLPRVPYAEKMHNPYRGGTFDVWYSGCGKSSCDLWVEYKFIPELPKRDTTLVLPDLSELQRHWGQERYEEGRNVWVILGCREGGVIYTDMAWEEALPASEIRGLLFSRNQIAERIAKFTCGF